MSQSNTVGIERHQNIITSITKYQSIAEYQSIAISI